MNLALPPDTPVKARVWVELAHKMVDARESTYVHLWLRQAVYRSQHSQSSSHKFYDKAKRLYDTQRPAVLTCRSRGTPSWSSPKR